MKTRNSENVLDDSECLQIVKKSLSREKMDDYSLVEYELIPIDGSTGFMGQYFTLKATVASLNPPLDTRIIHFFAKIPPPENSPQWEFNQEFGSFKKEVDLYTEVFPKVLKGLPQYSIPECFFGIGGDVIVLEDMMPKGYTMKNKFVPFDLDHCRIVMKTLAKFHAKSMIFEEMHEKNLLKEFPHCMHETLWSVEGRGNRGFHAAVNGLVSVIDLLDALEDEERIKFKEKIVGLSRSHIERLGASQKFRNVLCHGDLWANNLLFKYEGEEPDSCCLIDFQLARYNPPAHDILCFLQFSTTRELRDQHGDELFQLYHSSLSQILNESSLDAAKIFPLKEFLESIHELRIFCMLHGLLNTPLMLLESQAVEKYFNQEIDNLDAILFDDRTPLICGQFKEVKVYRERMVDALFELYDQLFN